MNNRHDYGKNGVLIFDNVREHIERNDFPDIPIGSVAGTNGWFIETIVVGGENRTLNPLLCYHGDRDVEFGMRYYFTFIRKDGSSVNTTRSFCLSLPARWGTHFGSIEIDWLLNDENGCLNDNGGLSIEYGIHVDSFKGADGIWRFNVFDKTFGKMGDKISSIREDGEQKFLHYHKQLVNIKDGFPMDTLGYYTWASCLQIAHGVRIDEDSFHLRCIAFHAQYYNLLNVLRYCERKLIEKNYGIDCIKYAIERKLNYLLAQLMKNLKSSKELKKILEDVDIQMMSGEAMKKCAMFFFKNSI